MLWLAPVSSIRKQRVVLAQSVCLAIWFGRDPRELILWRPTISDLGEQLEITVWLKENTGGSESERYDSDPRELSGSHLEISTRHSIVYKQTEFRIDHFIPSSARLIQAELSRPARSRNALRNRLKVSEIFCLCIFS